MRKLKDLIDHWQESGESNLTAKDYTVKLNIHDAARLEALAQMYPSTGLQGVITDLISAALHEVEATLPYIPGNQVIQNDELGDPIYEDVGPSKRFHEYTSQHRRSLEAELQVNADAMPLE